MSTQLDLQEQEQLDALKAFWKQYGNLITWALVAALAVYAAFNAWQWYQRDQAGKAGSMFTELERAVQAAEPDKAARVFADLKERHSNTAFAEQAGLLVARLLHEKGKLDEAKAALAWVAERAGQDEYRTLARMRLAGILLDTKQHDDALKQLDGATSPEFAALVGDRRGDVLLAQGKREEAKSAYLAAYKAMDEKLEYRMLLEAKLTSLGATPPAPASAASAASGVQK